MGAIAVYLYKHAKELIAWAALLAAIALCVDQLRHSQVATLFDSVMTDATNLVAEAITLVPRTVSQINTAIVEAVRDGDGWVDLIFWLFGLDVVVSMFTFVSAQISAIITTVNATVVGIGTTIGFVWVLKRVQRWVIALSGGSLSGTQLVD